MRSSVWEQGGRSQEHDDEHGEPEARAEQQFRGGGVGGFLSVVVPQQARGECYGRRQSAELIPSVALMLKSALSASKPG
jgi:hypothetical protein